MRTLLLPTLILFLLADVSRAQYQSDGITTFILVRHAEKVDDSRDPELSPEGYKRAELLAEMLSETSIDAVYSTNLIRTKETVRAITEENGIDLQFYDTQNPSETAAGWIEKHRGGVILISGHSNTTPTLANALLGRDHFQDHFNESDYGNLLIITLTDSREPRLLHLKY